LRTFVAVRKSKFGSLFGRLIGIVLCPHGVRIGFRGGSISFGRPNITIFPASFPLYFSRSSGVSASTPISVPFTVPFVAADHPTCASVSSCAAGEATRPHAAPRVQLLATVQLSRCAFCNPSALNCSCVQWLALSSCGEPVSRGPTCVVKYVKSAFN